MVAFLIVKSEAPCVFLSKELQAFALKPRVRKQTPIATDTATKRQN